MAFSFFFWVCMIDAVYKAGSHVRDDIQSDASYDKTVIREKVPCQPLPRELLQKIMGAAFNPRYMSIDKPESEDPNNKDSRVPSNVGQKDQAPHRRKKVEAFHVHESYSRILYDEPVVIDNLNFNPRHHVERFQYETDLSTTITPGFSVLESEISSQVTQHKNRHHLHHRHHRNHQQDGDENMNDKHSSRNYKQSRDSAKNKMSSTSMIDYKSAQFEQSEPSADEDPRPTTEKTRDKSKFEASDKMGPTTTTPAEKFMKSVRSRRSVKNGFPWSCESKIEWIDLGANHFPRFLRTVKCTSDQCWFGHFQCRPKAFTVKILRRRKDSCTMSTEPNKSSGSSPEESYQKDVSSENISQDDMDAIQDANSFVPPEFREQWIFEERAVTFCCECAS